MNEFSDLSEDQNIKLPVTFLCESLFQFHIIFRNRLALGILQGGGGISRLGNEDKPIFSGYVRPDQPEFLVIFYKLFQMRQTHRIRNASFLLAILGKCTAGKYCNDY